MELQGPRACLARLPGSRHAHALEPPRGRTGALLLWLSLSSAEVLAPLAEPRTIDPGGPRYGPSRVS
jgi:hypothetical protein